MTTLLSHSFSPALWAGRAVGLLGGSFNPAHDGHVHISQEALKRLKLDAVWWLVSPQNPLKSTKGMAPLDKRVKEACMLAGHPRIHVTDIERQLGTRYTADTLATLKNLFPSTRFVWLMGADSLQGVHRWHRWPDIFNAVPVAVLDRPPRGAGIKTSPALLRFGKTHLPEAQAALLKDTPPPAWTYLHVSLHDASSTKIRKIRKLRDTAV